MRLHLILRSADDDNIPIGRPDLHTGLLLPRGCGKDAATIEIEKAANSFKRVALELFEAETEGREPKLDGISEHK